MGCLLLHWPVDPGRLLNSILQATTCLHRPLLIWCAAGPGSCQALRLAAGGQVHAFNLSCLSCAALPHCSQPQFEQDADSSMSQLRQRSRQWLAIQL